MKKFMMIALALLVLLIPATALAAAYYDSENLIYMDIDASGNTYFYTPGETNLFADLSEKLEKEQKDIRFFVTSFTDSNDLAYSIMVVATPVDGEPATETADAAEAEPDEDASAEPTTAPTPPAAGPAALGDITALPEDEKAAVIEMAIADEAEAYTFSDPMDTTLGGQPAILISGAGVDSAYRCNIYITANSNNYIVTSMIYTDSANNVNFEAASAQLNTIQFAEEEPTASPEPIETAATPSPITESAEETPTSTAVVVDTAETPPPETDSFFQNISNSLSFAYRNDPNFVFYAASMLALLAVVIFLILFARYKYVNRKKQEAEAQETPAYRRLEPVDEPEVMSGDTDGTPVIPKDDDNSEDSAIADADKTTPETGIQPEHAPPVPDTQESATASAPATTEPESDFEEIIDRINKEDLTMKRDQDFTEDISKYTRQPGIDVNDISKNTMGGYRVNDELTKDIADNGQPASSRSVPDWKTTGSRVERHRKKKR